MILPPGKDRQHNGTIKMPATDHDSGHFCLQGFIPQRRRYPATYDPDQIASPARNDARHSWERPSDSRRADPTWHDIHPG